MCLGLHHHHHVVPLARISLILSRHFSRSFIAFGRSSGLNPVSSPSCCMYVRASRPAFARPYAGVHWSTSLMSSSLLLQQCLVRLAQIIFVVIVVALLINVKGLKTIKESNNLQNFLLECSTKYETNMVNRNKQNGKDIFAVINTHTRTYIYIYIYMGQMVDIGESDWMIKKSRKVDKSNKMVIEVIFRFL